MNMKLDHDSTRRLLRLSSVMLVLVSTILSGCRRSPAPPENATQSTPDVSAATPETEPEDFEAKKQASSEATPSKSEKELRDELVGKEVLMDFKESIVLQGAGPATTHPTTRTLCWPACICTYSKCPSRDTSGPPRLFAYRYPAVTVGADGKPDWSANEHAAPITMPGTCPYCFKVNTVEPYVAPEHQAHYQDILKKIKQKQAEFRQLTEGGKLISSEKFKEMRDLMNERAAVPLTYLCE